MSYRRITFEDRMIIFKLYHFEHLKKSAIAYKMNRSASSISREIEKGLDSDSYNPFIAELNHLRQRKYQSPDLTIDTGTWTLIKQKLELRWSPDQIAKWLKKIILIIS